MSKAPDSIRFIVALLFMVLAHSGVCHAVSPYDNWALPEGWLLAAYPAYYEASEFKGNNGSTVIPDLGAKVYQTAFRSTYYNKSLLPHTFGFTALMPVGRTDLKGDSDSGIGDLSLALGYWFVDDPSSKTYLVAGSYVDAPTGSFDKAKAANMGKGVWKVRPMVGAAKRIGDLDLEATLYYNVYEKNRETGVTAGSETIFESYVGYYILPGFMLGGNVNALYGQDRRLNGVSVPDTGTRKFQAGPTVYWRTSAHTSVTVTALSEFGVRNSSEGLLLTARLVWRLQP